MHSKNSIERQTIFFDFYVRKIWPLHRLFVKKYISKRCIRCAIAEECSPLDRANVCAFCREYEEKNDHINNDYSAENVQLDNLFKSFESKGRGEYDALVLFSGGKDSSFLLHKLQREYPGLRLLALTVNNAFMSKVAMENATTVAKKLKVDHIIYAPKPHVFENMFHYAFKNLRGLGSAATIDMLDGEFLIDQGRIMAATMHIPLVIIGYSHEQVKMENLENPLKYEGSERRTTASVYSIEELTSKEDLHYWWDGSRYSKEDIPRVAFPFYAWNLSEEFIKSEVNRHGLIEGTNNSPLITNNTLIPLQGFVDVATLGYSSWEPEFTQMVRKGTADRELWQNTFELLQYSARTGRFVDKAIFTSLAQLKLTPKDVGLDTLINKW